MKYIKYIALGAFHPKSTKAQNPAPPDFSYSAITESTYEIRILVKILPKIVRYAIWIFRHIVISWRVRVLISA